jgi:hypothetical protein
MQYIDSVVMLSVDILNVANKPFMLSVIMLNVVALSVVVQSLSLIKSIISGRRRRQRRPELATTWCQSHKLFFHVTDGSGKIS